MRSSLPVVFFPFVDQVLEACKSFLLFICLLACFCFVKIQGFSWDIPQYGSFSLQFRVELGELLYYATKIFLLLFVYFCTLCSVFSLCNSYYLHISFPGSILMLLIFPSWSLSILVLFFAFNLSVQKFWFQSSSA